MTAISINILVQDDTIGNNPVVGVLLRIFDSTGTNFITQATTDSNGVAAILLPAPSSYQVRFFKEQFSIQQPQLFITVDDALHSPNNFAVIGHVWVPPEAVHPRLCRCSGFFKNPDNSAAIGHVIHIIPKFKPLLFEGSAMLTELLKRKTDERGYIQFDLIRFGEYDVTVEGFEDQSRLITVPDEPGVNLPDLLFPVVTEVDFDPEGPWAVRVGNQYNLHVTTTVRTSDDRVLPGVAMQDVMWSTQDPTIAAALPGGDSITIRGLSPGMTQLLAVRADQSIVRIPDSPIQGVPVTIQVVP